MFKSDVIKNSKILFKKGFIISSIKKLSHKLNNDFINMENITLLCVMNGAIIFFVDLIKNLKFNFIIDYIHIIRYKDNKIIKPYIATKPIKSFKDKNVIIVDDILDSGLTLKFIYDYCINDGAKSIKTVVMVNKQCERDVNGLKNSDYFCLNSPNKFLFGYGLDHTDSYRHIMEIRYVLNF